VPFWPLYLESLSFSAREIGELMAIVMATKIIAPNVWGWIADHTGQRMNIVRIGSLLSVVFFIGVFIADDYWWLALVMGVFSFFWNATLPQFEANTFIHLGNNTHHYSSIRLWGSIGFVVAATAIGAMLGESDASLIPIALITMFIAIAVMSFIVPERAAAHMPLDEESIFSVIRKPEVASLIWVVLLMQASHGPYYTLYSLYLEDHGYSKLIIGGLWSLGVIAEVVVFIFIHRLIPAWGLRALLIFSLAIAVLRWVLLGHFVDSLSILILIQLGHGATFGVFHAVAIQYFHHYFKGRHQGRGQAIYSSMSFGAGGAIGALLAGYTWEFGPVVTFYLAAGFALIAIIISSRFIRSL